MAKTDFTRRKRATILAARAQRPRAPKPYDDPTHEPTIQTTQETPMPQTWDQQTAQTGGEYLKLQDGDSALCHLLATPMALKRHTVDDGSPIGRRVICATHENPALPCPVCDSDCSLPVKGHGTECAIALYVATITRNKQTEEVNQPMLHCGGWSILGAYRDARDRMELDGLDIMETPIRVTRAGSGRDTRYTVVDRPGASAAVPPDTATPDLPAVALAMIKYDWSQIQFTPPADPFAGIHDAAQHPAAPAPAPTAADEDTETPGPSHDEHPDAALIASWDAELNAQSRRCGLTPSRLSIYLHSRIGTATPHTIGEYDRAFEHLQALEEDLAARAGAA